MADGRVKELRRLALLRTVRFYKSAQAKESRPHVLRAMKAAIEQGDLADAAIEDLRSWKMWDLTDDVLKVYDRKGLDGTLTQKAVVRYALCCAPSSASRAFLARARRDDAESVKDVEEGLKYEKK